MYDLIRLIHLEREIILSRFDINWYGEKSLITECEMIESDSTKLKELGVDREEYVLLGEVENMTETDDDDVLV